jgi:hypothetical protein
MLVSLTFYGGEMGKKALITVSLVEESSEYSDEEIEREIYSELSKEIHKIPWAKKIEKVTVDNG